MRLAMWSGPRNLSTAMMYSFGNRSDFSAMDEPFYAAYLAKTGAEHPMRDEILAAHETDPDIVSRLCRTDGTPHLYMKHMPHHMVDGMPFDWAEGCFHVHLIRHPARVIASYAAKRAEITMDDIGFVQQLAVYKRLGGVVIDSSQILADPEKALGSLCAAIEIPFDAAMLNWSAGPRNEDGIWAKHWYGAVHKSTGFGKENPDMPDLEPQYQFLLDAALPAYDEMAAQAL